MRRAAPFLVPICLVVGCQATTEADPTSATREPQRSDVEQPLGQRVSDPNTIAFLEHLLGDPKLARSYGVICELDLETLRPPPLLEGVVELVAGPVIVVRSLDVPPNDYDGPLRFDLYLGHVYKGRAACLTRLGSTYLCHQAPEGTVAAVSPGDLATTRL